MATLTIRNLSDRAHDALRRRAAENRRSMEAEARLLIESLGEAAPKPAMDETRLKQLQARAVAAFGAAGVDQFIADRGRSWDE